MQTDQITLQRAIKGDEAAMRQLWLRHSPHIDAVVRRLCGDHDVAADIAQEVWIQIFRALPGYRGESQFGTWAHRIAVNRTLNALRKIKRIAKLETEIEDDSAFVEGDSDTDVPRGIDRRSDGTSFHREPEWYSCSTTSKATRTMRLARSSA